jgi:hypothetical protein
MELLENVVKDGNLVKIRLPSLGLNGQSKNIFKKPLMSSPNQTIINSERTIVLAVFTTGKEA